MTVTVKGRIYVYMLHVYRIYMCVIYVCVAIYMLPAAFLSSPISLNHAHALTSTLAQVSL